MKHIIVADDDPGIQDVLAHILERAGYQATIFGSADALLENQFDEPDVFLIDRQLQNADGLDVCRFLKQREGFAGTPVIIFSASACMHEQAIEAGANDFLEKPFKLKALLDIIEKHVA